MKAKIKHSDVFNEVFAERKGERVMSIIQIRRSALNLLERQPSAERMAPASQP